MERVATGIAEFDALIEGGFPKGSTTLLTGLPGTGKSIFALQYLFNGIKKGENGIYVYTEASTESIKNQALQMGFDIDKMQNEGKFALMSVPLSIKKFDLLYAVKDMKGRINAKRLVFDSLATFSINMDLFTIPEGYAGNVASTVSTTSGTQESELRRFHEEELGVPKSAMKSYEKVYYRSDSQKRLIFLIIESLRDIGTTNLLITFSGEGENGISIDGVSEFVADSIIRFYNERIGAKHIRTLNILKMRNTNHSQYIHDFEISKDGIKIKPAEQLYR